MLVKLSFLFDNCENCFSLIFYSFTKLFHGGVLALFVLHTIHWTCFSEDFYFLQAGKFSAIIYSNITHHSLFFSSETAVGWGIQFVLWISYLLLIIFICLSFNSLFQSLTQSSQVYLTCRICVYIIFNQIQDL